jgi:hypothetical protein
MKQKHRRFAWHSKQKKNRTFLLSGVMTSAFGNLSCYSSGMMGYQTPNIDRIAKEGMRFTSIILSVLIVLVSTQVQAQEEKPAGKRRRRQSRNGDDYRDGRRDRLRQAHGGSKRPKGNVVTLKVGPEAKNFKQIKTGDHVTAKYYRATAIYVRKPDEPPFAQRGSAVQLAAPGQSPVVLPSILPK